MPPNLDVLGSATDPSPDLSVVTLAEGSRCSGTSSWTPTRWTPGTPVSPHLEGDTPRVQALDGDQSPSEQRSSVTRVQRSTYW